MKNRGQLVTSDNKRVHGVIPESQLVSLEYESVCKKIKIITQKNKNQKEKKKQKKQRMASKTEHRVKTRVFWKTLGPLHNRSTGVIPPSFLLFNQLGEAGICHSNDHCWLLLFTFFPPLAVTKYSSGMIERGRKKKKEKGEEGILSKKGGHVFSIVCRCGDLISSLLRGFSSILF